MANELSFNNYNVKPIKIAPIGPVKPFTMPSAPATDAISGQSPAGTDFMSQIQKLYPDFYAQNNQIKQAAGQVLPMYQARLGGFDSATGQAMRLQGANDIQNQYGNALRAATSQAGAQGVRGPAAIAMQNDVRNQMGKATADFNTNLTAKNWDAQTQALQNYYSALATERGGILGTLGGLQQQVNTDKGMDAYNKAIAAQLGAANQSSGLFGSNGGIMNTLVSPQTIAGLPATPDYLNPMSWLEVNLG